MKSLLKALNCFKSSTTDEAEPPKESKKKPATKGKFQALQVEDHVEEAVFEPYPAELNPFDQTLTARQQAKLKFQGSTDSPITEPVSEFTPVTGYY